MESIYLRQLADAIDELDALKSFDYQVRGDEINIEWTTGGSCNGYQQMRKAIARVVSERYQGCALKPSRQPKSVWPIYALNCPQRRARNQLHEVAAWQVQRKAH